MTTWDKQAFEREFQKIRLAQSADHPIIPFVPEMYLAEPDKLFAFIDRQVEEAEKRGKERMDEFADWVKGLDSVPWEDQIDEMKDKIWGKPLTDKP